MSAERAPELLDHLFRHQYGRMVAGLTRVFGTDQLDLVEDLVAESMVRALKTWPFAGIPDDPQAWLVRVASNLGMDVLRRRSRERRKQDELRQWAADRAPAAAADGELREIEDDTLRMMFTCCHPGLGASARVALTLKLIGGFGVAEIAAALLAKEATIAQRLSRAKAWLQSRQVAFEVPVGAELGGRLTSVLEVLYLMFNEGYAAHRGEDLVRVDLVAEAVRLTSLLLQVEVLAEPRAHALLALMLLLAARLPARTDAAGELSTLAVQDRSLWDRRAIAAGLHHFERSMRGDQISVFHVEAAITACHAGAPSYADTDWPAILERYDTLSRLQPSPIVHLNRAVAVAKVRGTAAGLAVLRELEDLPSLRSYHLLPATRAVFEWHLGDRSAAAASFAAALALACNDPERAFLERRLAACRAGASAPLF